MHRLFVAMLGLLFGLFVLSSCTHLNTGLFMLQSNPSVDDPASMLRGRELYEKNCVRCHGLLADGAGEEAATLAVPPTNFMMSDYDKSANSIAAHITYGRGDAMPAFEGVLTSEQIWDVANYLRSLQKGS